MRKHIGTVIFCVSMLGLLVWGMMGVQQAAAVADDGRRYTDTFYDEATSVFCATRLKAVSCVWVPRETIR